jgi:pimeloyl-ACP methyl ester carboxylesterase
MVHGAFCGGWMYERFKAPFEAAGHAVATPDLPGHQAGATASAVVGLSMSDYARSIARVCAAQDQPPILIGHSLGGLIAQLAAALTPVKALILLAPSHPWGVGVATPEEALSAFSLYALGPYWAMAVTPDYGMARRYLLDRVTREDRRWMFARMTHESGLALWETLNWWLDPLTTTLVRRAAIRAPVLGLAGGRDLIHPPPTVTSTTTRLGGEVRVFPAMGHALPVEPGWEDVAETCLAWLAGRGAP